MKSFLRSIKEHTFAKYLFSYILLTSVLMLAFLFILNHHVTKQFYSQRKEQFQTELGHTNTWLDKQFKALALLSNSLQLDTSPLCSVYKTESARNYYIHQELHRYNDSSTLISDIIFKPKNSTDVVSTKSIASYTNNSFNLQYLTPSSSGSVSCQEITFDPGLYLKAGTDQLILLETESTQYFLYFPDTKSLNDSVYFFVLDTNELAQCMYPLLENEISAVAMIDKNRRVVFGINTQLLDPYLDFLQLTDGIYSFDSSNAVHVRTGFQNEFSLIALSSMDVLSEQFNAAFSPAYLSLILLGVVSCFLICYSMRITYSPLKRISTKFLPDSSANQDYIKGLEIKFEETINKNETLTQKINYYRDFMQKSLFNTLFTQAFPVNNSDLFIDRLFDPEVHKDIFMICISHPTQALPIHPLQNSFAEILPIKDSCIVLNNCQDNAVFLLQYTGIEPNKAEALKELLNNYYEVNGYMSVLSESTDSPLNIPSLYEKVKQATSYWPEIPVVDCAEITTTESIFDYPHSQLKQLSISLQNQNMPDARDQICNILYIIDHSFKEDEKMLSYYTTSILLDTLTTIVVSMNKFEIKFDLFENLYNETLFCCRSCPYTEVSEKIQTYLLQLIDIYEQEISNKAISLSEVLKLIEENYCNPDFSISLLAEKTHVSIAHMSFLLKKELNRTFSDYRWELRFKKATELLINTDLSIDEISIALGYLNPSSFHRKFKSETGMSPSQFRAESKNLNLRSVAFMKKECHDR